MEIVYILTVKYILSKNQVLLKKLMLVVQEAQEVCSDQAAINFIENAVEDGSCEYCPEIEIEAAVSNISCITNDADVSVTIYPAGNYNFEWSEAVKNTSTLFDIPYGEYSATVSDEYGCTETEIIYLEHLPI